MSIMHFSSTTQINISDPIIDPPPDPEPFSAAMSADQNGLSSNTTTAFNVSVSGGVAPYQINWSIEGGAIITNLTTGIFQGNGMATVSLGSGETTGTISATARDAELTEVATSAQYTATP